MSLKLTIKQKDALQTLKDEKSLPTRLGFLITVCRLL
jgi:hypothetical protein